MPRPDLLKGKTRRIKTGCGNLYLTINFNEETNEPNEVFIRLGKAGGCAASQSEAVGRLITMALRAKVEVIEIIKQLKGIGCHQPTFIGMGEKTLSCSDAVAKVLEKCLDSKVEDKKEE